MKRARRNSLIASLCVVAVVIVAWQAVSLRHGQTARCPENSVALGARCCPTGQRLDDSLPSAHDDQGSHCVGQATGCPVGLALEAGSCVAHNQRVLVPRGSLHIGPSDWEALGVVAARDLTVAAFSLDSHEVTEQRWAECAGAGFCRPRRPWELGQPVRGVAAEEALRFCEFAQGRLPSEDEWIFASATAEALRYPWGPTGLVCRRASFGLESGPCAQHGSEPELAGMRPDGKSPRGLFDLSGNVAEWVLAPSGFHVAGGSYRSRLASELKSWSSVARTDAPIDVGLRCAYDVIP